MSNMAFPQQYEMFVLILLKIMLTQMMTLMLTLMLTLSAAIEVAAIEVVAAIQGVAAIIMIVGIMGIIGIMGIVILTPRTVVGRNQHKIDANLEGNDLKDGLHVESFFFEKIGVTFPDWHESSKRLEIVESAVVSGVQKTCMCFIQTVQMEYFEMN
jgi:hypothetical protein